MIRPWDDGTNSVDNAIRMVDVAFEFFSKLGVPYYAFHDRDIAPEGNSLKESHAILDKIAAALLAKQQQTASSCYGAPRTYSAIRDSCMALQPLAMQMCSPLLVHR
jgi:xylose isomerase